MTLFGQLGLTGGQVNHADLGLALFLPDGNTTGKRHVDAHIFGKNSGSLLRATDFKNLALLGKINHLAVLRGFQIIRMQYAKAAGLYGRLKVGGGLNHRFGCIGDIFHFILLCYKSTHFFSRAMSIRGLHRRHGARLTSFFADNTGAILKTKFAYQETEPLKGLCFFLQAAFKFYLQQPEPSLWQRHR
ncbi:MAG: hypothetical protein PSY14_01870 [bacterium]|nr:hypothetical protein [bacterium]